MSFVGQMASLLGTTSILCEFNDHIHAKHQPRFLPQIFPPPVSAILQDPLYLTALVVFIFITIRANTGAFSHRVQSFRSRF